MASMIRKKVAMLGSFAVGKTSLVRQFVSGIFSDSYLTTVGVKVDKKTLHVDQRDVALVLWDLHGEDEFQKIQSTYLRGTGGYFLVADGTRGHTLDIARNLRESARQVVGDAPFSLLINKHDLRAEWEIDDAAIEQCRADGWIVHLTSAKTGDEVEHAFVDLTRRMLDG